MNLLFLCNSRERGGAEIWVLRAASALRDRGHLAVVAAPEDGFLAGAATAARLPCIGLRDGSVLNRRSAARFLVGWRRNRRSLLNAIEGARRSYGIQLVHVGLTGEKLLLARGCPEPVVWTEHGPLPRALIRSPLLRTYRRAGLNAAMVHCVCDATRQHLAGLGFAPDRLMTVHTGLHRKTGSVERARQIRREMGIPPDAVVAATLSRLVWVKGLDSFLVAASRLAASSETVHFMIVGDGPLRGELEARSRSLGLNGRCHFTGHRSDMPDVLQAVDVLAAPSVVEGLPLGVLEAMHAGVPAVASRVGGHPELIVAGETGFLVDEGDVDALSDRLALMATDGALRHRLGSGARDRAARWFGHARFIDRLERLLLDAASTEPAARGKAS